MASQREREGDARERGQSVWDELIDDPIMEPTEAMTIRRGFFKTLFGTAYDRLGGLILVNLAVTLQLFVGVLLGLLIAAVLRANGLLFLILLIGFGAVFLAPALAGLFTYVRLICDPDSMSSLRDYVQGMRRYAARSWLLLFLQGGTGLLLWINLRFYASFHGSVLGLAVEFLVLLMGLIWAMAGLFVWPLLVRDLGWALLIRNAIFLGLAAPFSTVAILVGLSAVTALLIFTRVLWAVILFSAWALTANVALQRLVRLFRERQEGTQDPAGPSESGER
ncbi:MAG TPA: hypothetical protein VHB98_10150 [Chloroflexota bacterium]|jgi:uncharacterized membrane protein YesL|nr:hypothetical protein [Chloroflexota bacterium]